MQLKRFVPYIAALALLSGCSEQYQTTQAKEETPEERTARVLKQRYISFRDSSGNPAGECSNLLLSMEAKLSESSKPSQLPEDAKRLCQYTGDFGRDGTKRTIGLAAAKNKAWIYTRVESLNEQDSGSTIEIPVDNFRLDSFDLIDLKIDKYPIKWPQIKLEYTGNNQKEMRVYAHKGKFRYKQIAHATGSELCLTNLDFLKGLEQAELVAVGKDGRSVNVFLWDQGTYRSKPFIDWLHDSESIIIRMQPDGTYAHIMITEELVKGAKGDLDTFHYILFGKKKRDVMLISKEDPAEITRMFLEYHRERIKRLSFCD